MPSPLSVTDPIVPVPLDLVMAKGESGEVYNIAANEDNIHAAEKWFIKALPKYESLGDSLKLARIHHQLGLNAGVLGDFKMAEEWCLSRLLKNSPF